MIAWLREQPLDLVRARPPRGRRAARRAARAAQRAQAAGGARQARRRRWPGSTTSWPPTSRSSCSRPPRGPGPACSSASRTPRTCSAATPPRRARTRCSAFQEPGGPQLIVCSTRVGAQGITLTRASNVAFLDLEWTPGDPRPGRGPLPPHRPGGRGDRLVPARRRDDRRDDDRADRAQARDRRRGHRRPPRRVRGARAVRRARAARASRGSGCARWRSRYGHVRVGERIPGRGARARRRGDRGPVTGHGPRHRAPARARAREHARGDAAERAARRRRRDGAADLLRVPAVLRRLHRGRGGGGRPVRRVGAGDAPGAGHVRVAARGHARRPCAPSRRWRARRRRGPWRPPASCRARSGATGATSRRCARSGRC